MHNMLQGWRNWHFYSYLMPSLVEKARAAATCQSLMYLIHVSSCVSIPSYIYPMFILIQCKTMFLGGRTGVYYNTQKASLVEMTRAAATRPPSHVLLYCNLRYLKPVKTILGALWYNAQHAARVEELAFLIIFGALSCGENQSSHSLPISDVSYSCIILCIYTSLHLSHVSSNTMHSHVPMWENWFSPSYSKTSFLEITRVAAMSLPSHILS